jgi:antirestriction protein
MTCRIYVADLAAYNSGRLRGAWIDLDGKDSSDVLNEINAMLAHSPESNVVRRICPNCGRYQTRSQFEETPPLCYSCEADLSSAEWFPSAEEWAIHDHEGFAGLITSEWPDIGEVVKIAEFLEEHDKESDERRGLLWLVNDRGYSVADALDRAEDVRTYESDAFDLAGDYAQELAADCVDDFEKRASQWPFTCIDWKHAGRELKLGGDVDETTQDGTRFLVTNAGEF